MPQLVQVVASLLILLAFGLAQAGRMGQHSRAYLVLNVVGSGVLAAAALIGRQWGFLLLEGAWAVVSAVGLARLLLRGRVPGRV